MSIAVGLLPLPVINKSAEPSRVRPRPFSTARQVGLDSQQQIAQLHKSIMLSGMGLT